jgi:hypothetical protein
VFREETRWIAFALKMKARRPFETLLFTNLNGVLIVPEDLKL